MMAANRYELQGNTQAAISSGVSCRFGQAALLLNSCNFTYWSRHKHYVGILNEH